MTRDDYLVVVIMGNGAHLVSYSSGVEYYAGTPSEITQGNIQFQNVNLVPLISTTASEVGAVSDLVVQVRF